MSWLFYFLSGVAFVFFLLLIYSLARTAKDEGGDRC